MVRVKRVIARKDAKGELLELLIEKIFKKYAVADFLERTRLP